MRGGKELERGTGHVLQDLHIDLSPTAPGISIHPIGEDTLHDHRPCGRGDPLREVVEVSLRRSEQATAPSWQIPEIESPESA